MALMYKWAKQDKPAMLKGVDIEITAWSDTNTSPADTQLIWWKIISCYPSAWAWDQVIEIIELSSSWVITVTLAWNTTANCTYTVIVAPITWNDS